MIVVLATLGVALLLAGSLHSHWRLLQGHPALPSGHTRQVALWRPPRSLVAHWIIAENRRPGSAAWQIRDLRVTTGIQAYADRVSVGRTGLVTLFVSTTAAAFRVDAYRMGWYLGLGGRLVWRSRGGGGGPPPPPRPRAPPPRPAATAGPAATHRHHRGPLASVGPRTGRLGLATR
jgi:hypothetical protein